MTDQPSSVSFEAARDELDSIVRTLEAGGLSLEESLNLWDRGEQLATVCEQWLESARVRIQASAQAEHQQD